MVELEACLADVLWQFVGLKFEDGRLFTERMDASRLIVLLRTLAPRNLEGQLLQDFINALAVADELRGDRNFIVRGSCAFLDPPGVPVAASLREKSEPGAHRLGGASTLSGAREGTRTLVIRLEGFGKSLFSQPGSRLSRRRKLAFWDKS